MATKRKFLLVHFHALGETPDSVKTYIYDFIEKAKLPDDVELEILIPDAKDFHEEKMWFTMDPNVFAKYAGAIKVDDKTTIFDMIEKLISNPILLFFGSCTFFNDQIKPKIDKIHEYLNKELASRKMIMSDTILSGMSMGGLIALNVGLLSKDIAPKAVLSCNSFHIPHMLPKTKQNYLKIVACENDNIIPIQLHKLTFSMLSDIPYEQVINKKDNGHIIGEEGIAEVISFLRKAVE